MLRYETKLRSLLFCGKQREKEGLKALDVGNGFSESGLVPLVHLSSEQRNITADEVGSAGVYACQNCLSVLANKSKKGRRTGSRDGERVGHTE